MHITTTDRDSNLFRELMVHLDTSLAKKQCELEKPLSVDVTANLRGQIQEIRSIKRALLNDKSDN